MQIYKLSHTQKVLAVAVLAAAACAGVWIVMQTPQLAVAGSDLPTTDAIPAVQQSQKDFVAKAEMPGAQLPVAAARALPQSAAQIPALKSWQMGDTKAATPKIPLNEKIVDYAIVQLEQHPEQFPAVGEQIQLPMLKGQSAVANVQFATTNPNGDYTWSGHLQGYGDDYPVVMTYGEHSIFATITTPEGSYSMESIDGLGWLYKNPAEIELSNPGAKDFLDVNEAH